MSDQHMGVIDASWQQEQHRDELDLQRQALEALQAARTRPLSENELMALAYSAGLANTFYKEMHK
ncbi:MAG: hypothetical protein M3R13_11975 [Armatimonadota bacterium]|nr:hypothetical protein [Armatimonadota bacterium]